MNNSWNLFTSNTWEKIENLFEMRKHRYPDDWPNIVELRSPPFFKASETHNAIRKLELKRYID